MPAIAPLPLEVNGADHPTQDHIANGCRVALSMGQKLVGRRSVLVDG